MAFRLDRTVLDSPKVQRTPRGGIRVDAAITRTGIFEYHTSDGEVQRELRPAEEVHADASLSTLRGAPVTDDHPQGAMVDAANFRHLTRGHVDSDASVEGDKVIAPLVIDDGRLIGKIENGKVEVSAGYTAEMDMTPGVWNGQRYDAVQRNIRYNHVAIVDRGRAGPEVRLRLDSAGDCMPYAGDGETMEKTFEVIEGVRYEHGTEAHADAVARRDASDQAAVETQAKADAALAELTKERDELKARVDELEAVDVKALVAARASLLATAAKAKVDGADELEDLEVKRAVIKAVRGDDFDLEGKTDAYVDASYDLAVLDLEKTATKARAALAPAEEKKDEAPQERLHIRKYREHVENLRKLSHGPINHEGMLDSASRSGHGLRR